MKKLLTLILFVPLLSIGQSKILTTKQLIATSDSLSSLIVTYNGASVHPINAGTYVIKASLIDNSKLTFWDKYYPLITGGIFLLIATMLRIIIFIQDLKAKKNEDDDNMGINYDPIK